MILVISGTNRKNSATRAIAEHYVHYLESHVNEEVHFTNLENLPAGILNDDMYSENGQESALAEYQDKVFIPSDKMIIVSPEYNGGFPGVLKLFLDALSVRRYQETFKGKKVALVGVSTGRAGNLRGMEHLTGILHYLKVHVLPNKLPISQVSRIVENGEITDVPTQRAIEEQIREFLEF